MAANKISNNAAQAKNMRLIYLNTDTNTESGLFKTQVKLPIEAINEEIEISILNICNLNRWASRDRNFEQIPGLPMRMANSKLGIIALTISAFVIAIYLNSNTSNKVGFAARGYYGGLIGLFLSLLGRSFTWDPRSVFPLEMLGKGFFKRRTLELNFWLRLERLVYHRADKIICVSRGHSRYFKLLHKRLPKSATLNVVPCYTSPSNSYSQLSLNLPTTEKARICYIGSLDHGWNNIDIYAKIFAKILENECQLVVLTQSITENDLRDRIVLETASANADNLWIASVNSPNDQLAILKQCDYGLMHMEKVPDWFTRIGVKFAMYRSAGLPVITTPYFGGAATELRRESDKYSLVTNPLQINYKELKRPDSITRNKLQKTAAVTFSPRNLLKALNRESHQSQHQFSIV